MKYKIIYAVAFAGTILTAKAQQAGKPEETKVWTPVPKEVTTGKPYVDPPSDAIVLFDGKNLHQWVSAQNRDQPAVWTIQDNTLQVKKGTGDAGYELQVLDSYKNKTYVNGMAGSMYKQLIPLANPAKKPGEWQTYDVVWMAPVFNEDGSVKSPARVTVLFNGVLVENNTELAGPTLYIGKPVYKKHGPSPIKLQAHGDKSEPISFRNIWVREL
jgi:hypothetical protein